MLGPVWNSSHGLCVTLTHDQEAIPSSFLTDKENKVAEIYELGQGLTLLPELRI